MSKSILIFNCRLLDETMDTPGAVLVVDSKIRSVFQGYFTSSQTVQEFAQAVLKEDGYGEDAKFDLFDAHGLTLTPSFIDMHVHLRYPGQTDKEDLNSGLQAAVAGGYGTIVAMPNTSPVVSSIDMAMKIEREAASLGLAHMFQVVSITKDFDGKTINHISQIDKKYVPVISEDGRDVLSSAVMLEAMLYAAEKGLIVSCHCEDPSLAAAARPYRQDALKILNENETLTEEQKNEVYDKLDTANSLLHEAEDIATFRNISLAVKARAKIHLAHVSTFQSLEYIKNAKQTYKDLQITCEVTPHHLALIGTRDTNYIFDLVNPPLRPVEDMSALQFGIVNGIVDVISTDHAPHTNQDKIDGAPGFTGLETAFGISNTLLVQKGMISASHLSSLMSANPAKILELQKGLLKTGYDADLTLFDPEEEWVVKSDEFYSKGKYTPFEGKTLKGKVKSVFIDGRLVFEK